MKKKFSLQDVILMGIVAIAFGAIFVGTDWIYNVLFPIIGPFANEGLFGLWIMAGPLAIYLVRVPGSALVGEILAAAAEVLFGGTFGASALISGIVQGIGSEAGFAIWRYKNWDWPVLLTSAVTTTIVSFSYEYFRLGYSKYGLLILLSLFVVRLISVTIFGAILVKSVYRMLDRSKVVNFS